MNTLAIAIKNLRRKKIRSVLTIGGVSIAVAVLVSLMGFDKGYQQSLTSNIDRMGYQLLVTAKGCPYEAATMMLKGGGGLRYMEQDAYEQIRSDERIEQITPQLVATVFDPDRSEGAGGFVMFMGIHDSYLKLKPWNKFKSGTWFSSPDADEVIMGYEAAELEQRSVGDEIFIPGKNKILKVAGIFERTGTQDDGIIFMPLQTTQRIFDLPGKLTGVGIKLKDIQTIGTVEEDLYDVPGIQVISMAQVRGTILNLIASAKDYGQLHRCHRHLHRRHWGDQHNPDVGLRTNTGNRHPEGHGSLTVPDLPAHLGRNDPDLQHRRSAR